MAAWADTLVEYAKQRVDDRVRESLWARGASDEQIDRFGVGYLNRELPPAEYPEDFLEWSWKGKKLQDVYVFPLTNPLNEVLGFQFRGVERGSGIYSDFLLTHAEPVFFGLGEVMPSIWEHEAVVPVEGVFDFFPTQRVIPYAVPTLTAKVSEVLLRSLRRIVKRTYLFYDNDAIGRRACSAFLKDHGDFFDVRVLDYPVGVTLPNGKAVKDPGDLWEAWGDERFGPYLLAQME